jgi:IMP cyclohydrolase
MTDHTAKQARQVAADDAAYLASVYEFRHRICAALSVRADDHRRFGRMELAAAYREESLRAARSE